MSVRILIGIVVSSMAIPAAWCADDYLSPELRERVERLKRAVKEERSSFANARERVEVLWAWANAYALSGGHLPVNLTQTCAAILGADAQDEPVGVRQLVAMDHYVHELTVRDEQPGALGALSIRVDGPVKARSWQTIEVTYTVGEMPMIEGGRILVAHHFQNNDGPWQREDPKGDNYVTIRSSDPNARWLPETEPVVGMHGGFRAAQPAWTWRLQGAELTKGETITVTYGNRSGGGRGWLMQTFSNDASTLPIYVNLENNDVFFSLPPATFEVVGGDVYAVHAFAPSIVAVGETIEVSVRSEDFYYNRATGAMPEYEVLLNGQPYSTIPAGNEAIFLMKGVKFEDPGVYRFGFRSADGRITGESNPIWVQENPEQRIFWGETHGHCGFAEGQGTADGYFLFGRDDARLDFLTLSEHDIWMDDFEWKFLQEAVNRYTVEGQFLVFAGYEWTARRERGGHHNVFFRRAAGQKRVPVQEAPYLGALYRHLYDASDPEDVLVIPHAHQAADWRRTEPGIERLVEIMSMHGTFEWFGNYYLRNGAEVGFIAASDDHLSHPGYAPGREATLKQGGGLAAVFAAEKTTDAIFSALRARRTYGTSGQRIILDAALNGHGMGTRQPFTEQRRIKGQVFGTAPIEEAAVIKNGDVVWSTSFVEAAPAPSCFVQVRFESSSEPFIRDNPRGYRPWTGHIEVTGATVKGVTAIGLTNRINDAARIDPAKPNRVEFDTATRGRVNHFILELEGASTETKFAVRLRPAVEQGAPPVLVRPAARIPGAEFALAFSDMKDGAVQREIPVDRYRDRMELRIVNPHAPLDQSFEYVDEGPKDQGDYYYVRVRQLDGGLAWSSPFWVGGETPR